MAVWTMAWLGSRPIAAIANGMITDLVSVAAAVWLGVSVTLLSTMLVRNAVKDA